MKEKRLRIGEILVSAFGYLYALLFLISMLPLIFGLKNYVVRSGSMAPTIPVGSCIYVKKTEADTIKEGDIITYCRANTLTVVTHRVTKHDLQKKLIWTKGDANSVEDNHAVKYNQILGTVQFYIPFLGYFLAVHTIPGIKFFGIGLLLAVVFKQMCQEERRSSYVQIRK